MKNLKKYNKLHIYMIGIGGISMSGLAKILSNNSITVSGSDISQNSEIEILKKMGVKIYPTHSSDNITKDLSLVVYTGAIKKDNVELLQAKKLNIPTIERSKFLGFISKTFENIISISGTHGKTTTTAMIGEIFYNAGKNPTIHMGGESVNLNTNTFIGDNKYFIVEACEYRASFKYLKSSVGVITNIDKDHLDYYKDLNDINKSFKKFAKNSKVLIKDKLVSIKHNNIISIGEKWEIKSIKFINHGYSFKVYKDGVLYEKIRLNMLGKHNVINALYSIVVADYYKIDKDIIKKSIENFKGVKRRYETIFSINNTPVIIDYAHHPTEIKNSLEGIKKEYKKVLCVFQPHTYSRTISLFDEFLEVLKKEKYIAIFETYPAREKELIGGRAIDLYGALEMSNKVYFDDTKKLNKYIKAMCQSGKIDVVLILGAGDLAEKLRKL